MGSGITLSQKLPGIVFIVSLLKNANKFLKKYQLNVIILYHILDIEFNNLNYLFFII
tara:strand:+ start:186 stop:356 length:171 start_codon:yes stop_codon:yes gene_type:complete